eukprot:scaffold306317_cov37-Prasinocladus_malaysianus.AAC.1
MCPPVGCVCIVIAGPQAAAGRFGRLSQPGEEGRHPSAALEAPGHPPHHHPALWRGRALRARLSQPAGGGGGLLPAHQPPGGAHGRHGRPRMEGTENIPWLLRVKLP